MYVLDVNECEDSTLNKCDGVCNNTDGNYVCSCPSGTLNEDGRTCDGKKQIISII